MGIPGRGMSSDLCANIWLSVTKLFALLMSDISTPYLMAMPASVSILVTSCSRRWRWASGDEGGVVSGERTAPRRALYSSERGWEIPMAR